MLLATFSFKAMGITTMFCMLVWMFKETYCTVFLLIKVKSPLVPRLLLKLACVHMSSSWCVEIFGCITAFVCSQIAHLIIMNVQTYMKALSIWNANQMFAIIKFVFKDKVHSCSYRSCNICDFRFSAHSILFWRLWGYLYFIAMS